MKETTTLQKLRHRSAMAVPSLFTIGNLACGFFSIMASFQGNFYKAGWLIFVGMFLDGIDGKVARYLKAESDFGIEMDSLADLITFCAAPAFLVYFMALAHTPVVGSAIAFIYVLCGALRLAKFNAMAHAGTGSKQYFSGLPTPAAAAVLAAFAISYTIFADVSAKGQNLPYFNAILPHFYNMLAFVVVGLAVLMVSNIPYAAFKDKKERKKRSVFFIIFIAIIIYLLIKYPQNVVLLVFSAYVLMGLFAVLFRAFKNLK
ncbi:CDP-diacylglycerol--serine O-phosphatidyltransferase [Elusimicrobium simillimum]|uniref:CDP-diacylglycerol--serine O-phosphatidyltransferase n=1 Tax=Elusimicrobium simillimum TaxID=3143438 RepID=UPI003C6F3D27